MEAAPSGSTRLLLPLHGGIMAGRRRAARRRVARRCVWCGRMLVSDVMSAVSGIATMLQALVIVMKEGGAACKRPH